MGRERQWPSTLVHGSGQVSTSARQSQRLLRRVRACTASTRALTAPAKRRARSANRSPPQFSVSPRLRKGQGWSIEVTPDSTLNGCVHPGDDQYQFVRDVRASLGRPRRLDRFGDAVVFVFLWFWCSWMSFGLWALAMKVAYGNPVEEGEPSGPWPLRLYLGIPVAAAFAGVVVFICFGGIGWLRKLRK